MNCQRSLKPAVTEAASGASQDLATYRCAVPGVLLRHVLEHDYQWDAILGNAVASFQRKLCLCLYTPFSETTRQISSNKPFGVDVPVLSFARPDIERHFAGLNWQIYPNVKTQAVYGLEHIYLVWR